MTDAPEIDRLQKAILDMHGVTVAHEKPVAVTETHGGQTVWDGVAEVFRIEGHPKASLAFAWSHEGDSGGGRYVSRREG